MKPHIVSCAFFLSVGLASVVGCGGSDSSSGAPTAPTAAGGPAVDPNCPPNSSSCGPARTLTVAIKVGGGSPWSLNVAGLMLSGSGGAANGETNRIVGLSPGTVEVSGQFQRNVTISIGIPPTDVGGSIPLGSVQNIEGPVSSTGDCSIQYSGTGAASFRLRFTLNAAGAASSCRA